MTEERKKDLTKRFESWLDEEREKIIDDVYKICKIHPNERYYKDSRINEIINCTITVCEGRK